MLEEDPTLHHGLWGTNHMKPCLLGLILAIGLSSQARANDTAQMGRLCVLSAAVSPVKVDGRPWDGPSWSKSKSRGETGRSIISALVAKTATVVANLDPTIALSGLAAKAGLESYAAGTKAPDVRVRITLGEELLVETLAVKDSLAPSYSREHQHCSKPVLAKELGSKELRVILVDQDVRDDDMIEAHFAQRGLQRMS